MQNLFLSEYKTPFNSIPFTQIKNEYFYPAITQSIAEAKAKIEQIISNNELPTFKNTVEPLENIGKNLGKATVVLFNLNAAETSEEIQKIAKEVSPLLSDFASYITFNELLFKKIDFVFKNEDKTKLSDEQQWYLERKHLDFLRSGILLTKEKQEQLKEISKELSLTSLKFGENVLAETNNFFFNVTLKEELEGIPESALDLAKLESEKRNLNGWTFTLHFPSIIPVLKFAKNRQLRKELYMASLQKAFNNNDKNNIDVIKKINELRAKKAEILGFDSYASLVLEERMAENTDTVKNFLKDMLAKAKPFAIHEIEKIKSLAFADGILDMQSYDHAYYAEKLKEQLYNFSEEELKPFFELNNVLQAVFDLSNKLFNLTFEEITTVETYHKDVKVFDIKENGKHKALLYTDFFPREGKRQGAWMTTFQNQYQTDNEDVRPHVSIVCNFTPATEKTPSLLTFTEVTTLFHEMGHALHMVLSETQYESLSGTHVFWDFVELPSQFLENYCFEKEFLQSFAKHYKSKEVLADEMIDKIVVSSNFMEGYQTMRQLSFGLLDFAYHTQKLDENFNPEKFEKSVISDTLLYPSIDNTCVSTSFSHIFAGGYAAGYYSYKWAEVLDADAFAYFKENGIFNSEISKKYKTLLSQGGTKHPMKLYQEFRGRKPTHDALLKRAGLI